MRITYIANTLMPTDRAHGFQIAKTCEKFAAMGNEVLLLVPNRKETITKNKKDDDLFDYYNLKRNFKVEKISSPDFIFLTHYIGALAYYLQTFFFSFQLFFKKMEKDIIIFSRDILPILIFKLKGFKVIYNAHNWSKKRAWLLGFCGRRLKIVCNSEGTKAEVLKSGFKSVLAVPNGVDIDEFENLGEKLEIIKRLNLPTDKKIVMYVGHLYTWKGGDTLLGLAKLLSARLDIVLAIVGGDEIEIKEYLKKMEGLPTNRQKADEVSQEFSNLLLLGHKFKKDIPSYLKSADILLLPNTSQTEESVSFTSPIKMFEYMASGVPIIASNLPSLRAVLNEQNALLVEPDNAAALLKAIEKILVDNNFAQNIGRKAKEDVKKYTWNEYAKKILNFIAK